MANRRRRLGVGLLMMGTAAWLVWPVAIVTHRGIPIRRRALRVVKRRYRPRARVLVVGDGPVVDSPAPHVCVADRLAEAHPEWSVGSLAPGARRTVDVARWLGRLARRIDRRTADAVYDAVVIHTGGRDVLRFTREGPLAVALVEALAAANRVARHTVLAVGGDLVPARAFPPPWSWVFSWRGQWVRGLFQAVAWEAGVAYVDRIRNSEAAHPTGDPERSSARAGEHWNDNSYELWLDEIDGVLRSWIAEDVDDLGQRQPSSPLAETPGSSSSAGGRLRAL